MRRFLASLILALCTGCASVTAFPVDGTPQEREAPSRPVLDRAVSIAAGAGAGAVLGAIACFLPLTTVVTPGAAEFVIVCVPIAAVAGATLGAFVGASRR